MKARLGDRIALLDDMYFIIFKIIVKKLEFYVKIAFN